MKFCLLALSCVLLAGCVGIPSPRERFAHADALASAAGWQAIRLATGRFTLAGYVPAMIPAEDELTIYLEGDGFAWVSGSTPSTDPTPRDPLALRLALVHPHGNAAYLARPCQYVDAEKTACPEHYWTEQRFAPEAVEAMNVGVDRLKARFGAKRLTLVGYSGGGNVAALLAARRDDVTRLVTVAGNLDHAAWTTHHRVRPLAGSLNAADFAGRLANLPQTHFVGGKDRVIPPELAGHWPAAFRERGRLRIVAGFDHACCWAERWQYLMDPNE